MRRRAKRLQFFCDEDYGWLRVHLKDLHDLGIADKISVYSNQRVHWVYLDEYMDMDTYLRAAEENDWDLIIGYQKQAKYSSIRDLESYRYDPRLQSGRGKESLEPLGRPIP